MDRFFRAAPCYQAAEGDRRLPEVAVDECATFLPGEPDLILLEYGIMADQVGTLYVRLGNQHAIEGVLVVVGQTLKCKDVGQENR